MEKATLDQNLAIPESRYIIAPISYRIGAFLVDFFMIWAMGMILGMFFGTPSEEGIGYDLNGLPALLWFSIGFFLWPISEGIWGQTIGKRLVRIKVVSIDDRDTGFRQVFLRFLFAFIDLMFCSGLIIAYSNKHNQRLGDWIAKTKVVKEELLPT